MPEATARSLEWKRWNGRVHARAKQLGLGEDARRDLQRRVTGKESCRDMTATELRRVVAAMNGRTAPAGRPATPDSLPDSDETRALVGKLRALWISGWHLGVVRDRTDDALAVWLRGQTGLDAAAWTNRADLVKAVEALRAWLAREAGVDWQPHILLNRDGAREEIECPASRVLEAQWRILAGLGRVIGGSGPLGAYASRFAELGRKDSHLALDVQQTNALIAQLGKMVREARRG